MKFVEIAMPVLLIILAFGLKLTIDRTVTVPDTIASILDLPADIAFFSLSVIVSYTLAKDVNRDSGLMHFCGFIFLSLVVIFLWRRSLSSFSGGKRLSPILLGAMNYAVTISMAIYTIRLVMGEG